jgi:hypothetical protein
MSALADHIHMPGTAARLRWTLSDALALARRNLEHVRQIPEKLIDVTVQPLMFVLLFAYVFGGVVDIPGGSYHEYLLGGIMVQSLAFGWRRSWWPSGCWPSAASWWVGGSTRTCPTPWPASGS